MTGWGQDGPLAPRAGHDINYIALTGVLHAIGRAGGAPVPPLNLVGDFGGGGMLLAFGVACALLEAQRSGQGQVVDAAMVDGASLLATMFRACGRRALERRARRQHARHRRALVRRLRDPRRPVRGHRLDRAEVLRGAVERLGIAGETLPDAARPRELARAARRASRDAFRAKTRDEWCAVFEGTDACFAPVLSFAEAPRIRTTSRATRS